MYRKVLFFFWLISALSIHVSAQTGSEPNSISINKAVGEITLDGKLDEADWQSADVAKSFQQNFPVDTGAALTTTEVRVTYDDKKFYVGAICHDPLEGDYIIQSLKRDFSFPVSDGFAVFLDPFNDGVNGFSFAVNPLGVQREGLLQNGGGFGVTTNWDNNWQSKVTREDGKWIVEMAIPFKTLRYKDNVEQWGINFARNDLKRNEMSAWSRVPRNLNIADLGMRGTLNWDKPPKKAGANIALIPYAIGNVTDDYENKKKTAWGGNLGLDAKVAITSSLNLDLTINPDFSQVEVDRQQTNLSRFSLFFPEQRNFFIENSDLFSTFGFSTIRPFFSRRIGLNSGQKVPILGGLRLSGKPSQNWRIGVMTMQTEGVRDLNLKSQNYTVAAAQRNVFKRSNIAGILVHRQAFDGFKWDKNDYNTVAGLDFNLYSNDGKWRGKAFYHQSFKPKENNFGLANANATWLMYNTPNFRFHWNHEYVGKDYQAEVGFVPRGSLYNPDLDSVVSIGFWRLEPSLSYTFIPRGSNVLASHGPGIRYNSYFTPKFGVTDTEVNLWYDIDFLNSSGISVSYNEAFTLLRYDTDVSFDDNDPISRGGYSYRWAEAAYESDQRKRFTWEVAGGFGKYYNGTLGFWSVEASYRAQPWGIFSVSYEQNEIRLPNGRSATIALIGPEIQLSFTKNLFWTTFVQYNTQAENVNINARIQWRFKPMSDLYLVYTDNYDPVFNVKNRAVVMKLIWWLAI
ncbi:MAG: hypothetical protein ACI85G_001466 [Psychroserpens sp.]